MKNLYLLLIIFLAHKSISQVDTIKRYSLSFEGIYHKPFGNNFLNKCYKPNVGFGFEAQINFKKFFFGFGYKTNSFLIINKELIGNFQSAEINFNYLFVGYRHYLKNKKIYFEERIGFGSNDLYNYSNLSNYKIFGKSYFLGSKANYNLFPKLNFYLGIDLISTRYNVVAEESLKIFYNESFQFEPKLGLKYLWGTKTK